MEIIEFFSDIKIPMAVIHVISVVLGMGAALMSDVLFTFYGNDKKLSSMEIKTLKVLSNIVWIGLVIISMSGLGLFLSDIPKYIHSVKFLAKMSILAILLVNGYVLHKYIWKHIIARNFLVSKEKSHIRKFAFACGAISVLSWITICSLGVLDKVSISYGVLMAGYGVLIIGGVLVALLVESREFER